MVEPIPITEEFKKFVDGGREVFLTHLGMWDESLPFLTMLIDDKLEVVAFSLDRGQDPMIIAASLIMDKNPQAYIYHVEAWIAPVESRDDAFKKRLLYGEVRNMPNNQDGAIFLARSLDGAFVDETWLLENKDEKKQLRQFKLSNSAKSDDPKSGKMRTVKLPKGIGGHWRLSDPSTKEK